MMAARVFTAFLVCILAKDAISRGVFAIWPPRGCQQPCVSLALDLFESGREHLGIISSVDSRGWTCFGAALVIGQPNAPVFPSRSGRSPDWLKIKNPALPAVRREAEKIVAGIDGAES